MSNRLLFGYSGLLGSVLLVATACDRSGENPDKHLALPAAPVSQVDLQTLRTEIRDLRRQVFQLSSKISRYESVAIDPTEKGYGRIDTSSGVFLVAVRDAKPYLDGYRLSLAVGNLSSARYDGFKMKLSWQGPLPEQKDGESDEQYSKRMDQWGQSRHEKEFTSIETLHPASWNPISIVISPATAEEIRMLEVDSMETDRVLLTDRR